MQIRGYIVFVGEDFVRIKTIKKYQEVDVFFSEKKKEAAEILFEKHIFVILDVELQTFEYESNRFGKLWLWDVLRPILPDKNGLSTPQKNRRDSIAVLYRKIVEEEEWEFFKNLKRNAQNL